jgi:GDPmannose 4,6-dehydratase
VRALVIGVSGQDGAYLSSLLLAKGYEVFGTSRDAHLSRFEGLERLGIRGRVRSLSVAPNDFRSVLTALTRVEPDEIYNLSGQSSVGLSFEQPVETMESVSIATLNLLEAIRFLKRPIRFYNAGSGECFGDTGGKPASEETPFRPRSPYAVAKAAAHFEVVNYREAYGLFACNGILFNHESPVRGEIFVSRKITRGLARIKLGMQDCLYLGNLDARRDWGHARDYVEAQWLMLQQAEPEDFVIATGKQHSVREFVEFAAAKLGIRLSWRGKGIDEHAIDAAGKKIVAVDPRYFRPTEVDSLVGDPGKARQKLRWQAKTTFEELVEEMVREDLRGAERDALLRKHGHLA